MPARVRWGTGAGEWKLYLWEFWKKCVSLKWASVQHMRKINSLPSSHLSELPPWLSQEILLKDSLLIRPFYTENVFVYIFNIWKQFSKIYRVLWFMSTGPPLFEIGEPSSSSEDGEWLNEWTLLPGSLQAIGVFQGCEGLPLNQYCDLTTLMYHCYRRNIFGLLCSKPHRPQSLECLSSSLVQQSVFSMGPRGRTLEQPRASSPHFTFWLYIHSLDPLGNFKSGL